MIKTWVSAIALAAVTSSAVAAEPLDLSLTGFGTIGAVYNFDSQAQFVRWGVNKPSDSRVDFGPDTILGVQASLPLGTRTDATVQVVSSKDSLGSYTPHVTWAFLRYALTPSLTIRAGRMRAPFFMLSDSLLVNYANLWVRPPVEVYSLVPVNELDGVDLLYREQIAGLELEVHPYFGRSKLDLFDDSSVELRNAVGLNLSLRYQDLTLHFGHAESRFSFERNSSTSKALAAVLNANGLTALAAQIGGDAGYARFDSLGFQWDDGQNILIGEYAKRRTNRYIASAQGWYLTFGRRIDNVTPYASFARQALDEQNMRGFVPAPLVPTIATYNTVRNNAQRSFALGVRWDLNRTVAFKTEWSKVHIAERSVGSFFPTGNPMTSSIGGKTFDTLSISVDVLF